MRLRWLSAVVGIPLFIGICVWGAVPFSVALTALAIIGLAEMLKTYWRADIRPNPLLALLGLAGPALPLIVRSGIHVNEIVLGVVVIVLAAMLWEVVQCAGPAGMYAGRNVGYGALCGLYVALFGGLSSLREFAEGHGWGRLDPGAALVLLIVFCVWATDSFAFFTGSAFGKHKLAPAISPGKTVEGALGGLIAALIVGAVFGQLLVSSIWAGVAAGALAGTLGQAGDLFESALKREAGVKDFGGILPGHGGVLDRFDSLLFVGPVAAVILPLII